MNARTVFVVDDDAAVRGGLTLLLETAGFLVQTFESADAFLTAFDAAGPGCLILDVKMPGKTGPELQQEMARRGLQIPILFLTAHGDIPTTVQTMRRGALDFLTKPVDGPVLLERVGAALELDLKQRERGQARSAAQQVLATLTERERRVLALALAGLQNKDIAQRLGISYRTVEVHRSHILLKTGASTLLGLAQLANEGGLNVAQIADPPSDGETH